jgi:hypothetical protein
MGWYSMLYWLGVGLQQQHVFGGGGTRSSIFFFAFGTRPMRLAMSAWDGDIHKRPECPIGAVTRDS